MFVPGLGEVQASLLRTLLVAAFAAWFLSFIAKFVTWRLYFRKLRAQGMPMPPHSFLFGHAMFINSMIGQLPKQAHITYVPHMIRKQYPELGPNFYLDMWPFAPSMLVLTGRETMQQVTSQKVLQKTAVLKHYVRPLGEDLDMLTSEGQLWKRWRSMFSPGFSPGHLVTLIPNLVDDMQVYADLLGGHAGKRDIFKMKQLTDNLTVDVIGKITLDFSFNAQRSRNPAVVSLRTIIHWLSFGYEPNLFDRYNPVRPFIHWYNRRILDKFVSDELDKRFAGRSAADGEKSIDAKRSRTAVDLAFDNHPTSTGKDQQPGVPMTLDPVYKRECMAQMKMFLFGGHDTTSTSICYNFYYLSRHPKVLAKVRDEHASVFGADPDEAASKLIETPHLINQLPYTTAVIKEAMRLSYPVTSTRQGEEGVSVVDSEGRSLPTEGFFIWINAHALHHDAIYWPDPEAFLPERWLAPPEDPLYPQKHAWRPFELGPRACIASDLAMIEMKLVLIMTARKYIVYPAYDVLAERKGVKAADVDGLKAYQAHIMQPLGDLPVWVERLKT